ncbi:hypothetical protein IWQ61_000102 [Dispira simplex]|nr:hypothetical protein IWQ61_000102 [Dispira simplex]
MNTQETLPSTQRFVLRDHQGVVNVCRYNAEGNYCLTGGQDKQIRLWNTTTGLKVITFEGHGWEVLDIAVAPDHTRFASGGGDRSVFLWHAGRGELERKWTGHTQKINAVAFNPYSNVLVSGSFDTQVRLWDLRSSTRSPIQIFRDAKDSIMALDVTDHSITVGSVDGFVRAYDIRQGVLSSDYVGQPVVSLSRTQDGTSLLVGTLDHTLRLFDVTRGSLLNQYTGHRNDTYRIRSCLSRKDTLVMSGSEDGTIWCWNTLNVSN